MATKAKAPATPPVKVTFSGVPARTWKSFQSKCKKANLSAAERLRQLIAADVKV